MTVSKSHDNLFIKPQSHRPTAAGNPIYINSQRFLWCLTVLVAIITSGCGNVSDKPRTRDPQSQKSLALSQNAVPHPESVIRFEDIAPQCGVHFVPKNGQEAGRFTILESLGTGVAVFDLDHDGSLDIIAMGGGTFDTDGLPKGNECGVFRQSGTLQFHRVEAACGLSSGDAYTHGVSVGDWNNDGFDDVLITGFKSAQLFRNCGDGTFENVTADAKLPQTSWSTSSAFLDADNDGDLEFYIVNYVDWDPANSPECVVKGHRDVCPPGRFDAISDWLFDNNGDGTFRDVSQMAGLSEGGKGLAVISGDVDLDGDTDLYIANDTNANFLYLNDGGGRFEEKALFAGCALGSTMEAEGSMGVEFADFNSDGLPDIWVSNYENQSFAMYESRAAGIFQHVSTIRGIASAGRLYVGFGTAALDADLDGDQDIFAANGHVMYESGTSRAQQLPLVYENMNGKGFRNVASQTGDYGTTLHMGRGLASGDLDNDGRMDLVVAHSNEPVAVLHNTTPCNRNWVAIELVGRSANRSAMGAYIEIEHSVRLLTGGGSYVSDGSNRQVWAVSSDESVEVLIFWPSGRRQTRKIPANGLNFIVEDLESRTPSD